MLEILYAKGYEFFDSRGNPTLAVEVRTTYSSGLAIIPSGASKGKREAIEKRDGGERLEGKGVLSAIKSVDFISKKIRGMNALNQKEIDRFLIELDGTENKSNLGANAILGVSIAVSKASAAYLKIPLYIYLGGENLLPIPLINVINGGMHAGWNTDFQEYILIPWNFQNFDEAVKASAEVFYKLKKILEEEGKPTTVGDEGGFSPPFKDNIEPIEKLIKAIEKAKYIPGENFFIGLDIAASSFFNGKYRLKDKHLGTDEYINILDNITSKFPIKSVEDPVAEDDEEGWKIITKILTEKGIQVVGDDVFVTNPKILSEGISKGIGNAILIKLNQIGTITETMETIKIAKSAGYGTIISHRSGDSEDSFIADFCVGVGAGQIKTGSLSRGERTAKYNRLIYIEYELGEKRRYKRTI